MPVPGWPKLAVHVPGSSAAAGKSDRLCGDAYAHGARPYCTYVVHAAHDK